jgi:uncharacterized protein
MKRVLTVVPFVAPPDHRYLYDDNTGMVFPSTPATEDLLKAHRDAPLGAAVAALTDRYSAEDLAAAAEFIERWETRFGAFYRSPEYRETIEKQMLDFSQADLEALVDGNAWVHVVLVLTEDCNLRCSYCYYSDAYPVSRNRTVRQLSFETGRKGLDYFFAQARPKVAGNPMCKLAVNFYGGEPLMAQRTLRQLAEYAKANSPANLVFAVTTNGTMLRGDIVDFLVTNDFHILVSLDGPGEDHDRNRVFPNGMGSFDRIEANLRDFRKRYPDYRNIHLSSVYDWQTDLERVNQFHDENADWLPTLQLASQANDRDTRYYERFTDKDREQFARSHRRLEEIYLDARLSGKPVPSFTRVYFEMRIIGALLRRRQGNLPYAIMPFTNTCVPGSKIAVRTDGTLDICERVNGTMPIGHVDRGLDFERIAEIVKNYNREVCRACWACPVTKLCARCFATCNTDSGFAKGDCPATIDGVASTLSAIYGILGVEPNAFADLSYFNPELQLLMR